MAKKITAADIIEVYIRKEARADGSEPYTYAIKDFGQKKAKKDPDRYASKFSAKRSALRKLGAWDTDMSGRLVKPAGGVPLVMRGGKPRRIVFISADEFEVKLMSSGAGVRLLVANEMDHAVRLLPGMRPFMEKGELGPVGDGRTEYSFSMPNGPELDGLIAWIKSNPGHYDYATN